MIEIREVRLGLVKMADVMFGGVFRTAFFQKRQHFGLERFDVHTFADDVILMQNVAHEMPVIEPVQDLVVNPGRQGLQPVAFIAFERNVEREDVFYLIGMDILITDRGTGGGKTVQPRDFPFAWGAGEIIGLTVREGLVQIDGARNGRGTLPFAWAGSWARACLAFA